MIHATGLPLASRLPCSCVRHLNPTRKSRAPLLFYATPPTIRSAAVKGVALRRPHEDERNTNAEKTRDAYCDPGLAFPNLDESPGDRIRPRSRSLRSLREGLKGF